MLYEVITNPIQMLNMLSYEKLLELGKNPEFLETLNSVYDNFKAYMNVPFNKERPSIAYFSMEYA